MESPQVELRNVYLAEIRLLAATACVNIYKLADTQLVKGTRWQIHSQLKGHTGRYTVS